MWLLMQLLQCALHIEIVGYGFIPRYLSVVQDAFVMIGMARSAKMVFRSDSGPNKIANNLRKSWD
jgi:hypothetical protein